MMDEIVLAKNITDCSECPLFESDCNGGWTSDGAGTPIEPPCCSWNDDTEVYEGMYDYEIDYTPQQLKWIQEDWDRKEAKRKAEEHKREIQRLEKKIWDMTGGGYLHIELKYYGSIVNAWLCPYCGTWRYPGAESWHQGLGEAWCGKCNRTMVYCSELEEEYGFR